MDKFILYSTGCPLCEVAKNTLKRRNIQFFICDDISVMELKGYVTVPVLEVYHEGKTDVLRFVDIMTKYGLTEQK